MNRGRSGTPGGPPKPVTVKTAGHWFWFDRSMNDLRIQQIRDLVDRRSDGKVLSVFCRTDPREPENMGDNPGWMINLRNLSRIPI